DVDGHEPFEFGNDAPPPTPSIEKSPVTVRVARGIVAELERFVAVDIAVAHLRVIIQIVVDVDVRLFLF
ncbi:hypothetical protein ACUY2Q_01270, partial [Corynebacterium bovis]